MATLRESKEITTSSDEQYRLMKMINGNNGMSYQDALDEEIDNAIDEIDNYSEGIIELTFNDGKLQSIYNNGNPMTKKDREAVLTLDGRSKLNKAKKKGRFGIGGANARARLAGQGSQIITTYDGEDLHQVIINLDELTSTKIQRCWTGDHEFRPRWRKNNDSNLKHKYKQGVTKEYIAGKNPLTQSFNLNNLVKHLAIKYQGFIEKDLDIKVNWGEDKEYQIPNYLNTNVWKKQITIDLHNDGNLYFKYNNQNLSIIRDKNGVLKPIKKTKTDSTRLDNETFTVTIIAPKGFGNNKTNKNKNWAWNHRNQNIPSLFQNIELNENGDIIFICGNEKLEYNAISEEDNECKKSNTKRKLNTEIENLRKHFIPGILIYCDDFPLTYDDFIRKEKKGGDFDKRFYEEFIIEVKFKSKSKTLNLQENKDKFYIPDNLEKAIQKIISLANSEYKKEVENRLKVLPTSTGETKKNDPSGTVAGVKTDDPSGTVAEVKTDDPSGTVAEMKTGDPSGTVAEMKTDNPSGTVAGVKTGDPSGTVAGETKQGDKDNNVKTTKTQLVKEHMRGSIEKTEWDKVYQKLIEKFCNDGKVNNCAEIYNKMVDLINA